MKIFEFKESNRGKLREFQDHHGIKRIPLFDRASGDGETLFLELNSAIQGIATVTKNGFHPKYDHLYFAVANRDSEVTQKLYRSLIERRVAGSPPLQIMYEESDVKEQRPFTEKFGFSLTLTCNCPQIDVGKSLDKISEVRLPSEFRVLRYNQLDSDEKAALREFRLSGYVKTHSWSPPIDIGDELWKRTDLSPESDEISWCVFAGDSPLLCSDGHIDGDEFWLGWGWHADEYETHEIVGQAWSKVLSLQLLYCQRNGKRMFGEFDSTDKYAQVKSDILVHLTKDTKYIFQQKVMC